jgi:DNA-binding NarL/FixJ family response regulator
MIKFYNDEWETLIANCGFTDNELEVIKFLRKGWAYVDIAAELCVSLPTLKRRTQSIMQKILRHIDKT